MTKDELKQLSNETFFDNVEGGIEPAAHREFNNKMIEAMVAGGEAIDLIFTNQTNIADMKTAKVMDFGAFYILEMFFQPTSLTQIIAIQVSNFDFGNVDPFRTVNLFQRTHEVDLACANNGIAFQWVSPNTSFPSFVRFKCIIPK